MVQRSQEQHGVKALVRKVQLPGVPQLGPDAQAFRGQVAGGLDVTRDKIDEEDLVTVLRQPPGVGPRSSSDVQHAETPGREMAGHDLLGPDQFELAVPLCDALALVVVELVVLDDVRRNALVVHRGPA